MKLRYMILTVLLATALGASAARDYEARQELQDIRNGIDNRNQIEDLRVRDAATIGGNADIDGTFTLTATALNVTNGQAVTVSAGAYTLNGIGGANDTTNTITLAAPAAAGELVFLSVATASTNLVTVADSGTVAASGAILMDGNDTAVLLGIDTSTWGLVSESDN